MRVVFVMNCQGEELASYMQLALPLLRTAPPVEIQIVVIYHNLDNLAVLDAVDDADVVICRNVKKIPAFTPESIRRRVKPTCRVLVMEYVFFDGFDPFRTSLSTWGHNVQFGVDQIEPTLTHEPPTLWDTFCKFEGDASVIRVHFNAALQRLALLDAASDIKFYDFFVQNYKHTRLFRNSGHPSPPLMMHLLQQILVHIGCEIDDAHHACSTLCETLFAPPYNGCVNEAFAMHFSLVFPTCKRVLGLSFDDSYIGNYYGTRCTEQQFFEFGQAVNAGEIKVTSREHCKETFAHYV